MLFLDFNIISNLNRRKYDFDKKFNDFKINSINIFLPSGPVNVFGITKISVRNPNHFSYIKISLDRGIIYVKDSLLI